MTDVIISPLPQALTRDEAVALLQRLKHPRPGPWLDHHASQGRLVWDGDPPTAGGASVWRQLLTDECDKLYNQAYCALQQIEAAEDPDDVMILALDDFPSPIEQAWSLAPPLAAEHLELMQRHNPDRLKRFLAEIGAGTDREATERAECLEFWHDNAELTSPLRQMLYRIVVAQLRGGDAASMLRG